MAFFGTTDVFHADAFAAANEMADGVLAFAQVRGHDCCAFDGALARPFEALLDNIFCADLAHEAVNGGDDETEDDDYKDAVREDEAAAEMCGGVEVAEADG